MPPLSGSSPRPPPSPQLTAQQRANRRRPVRRRPSQQQPQPPPSAPGPGSLQEEALPNLLQNGAVSRQILPSIDSIPRQPQLQTTIYPQSPFTHRRLQQTPQLAPLESQRPQHWQQIPQADVLSVRPLSALYLQPEPRATNISPHSQPFQPLLQRYQPPHQPSNVSEQPLLPPPSLYLNHSQQSPTRDTPSSEISPNGHMTIRPGPSPPHPRRVADPLSQSLTLRPAPRRPPVPIAWTPFFNPDLSQTPCYLYLMQSFFVHLDVLCTGLWTPEMYADFEDAQGVQDFLNTWRHAYNSATSNRERVADQRLRSSYETFNVEYRLAIRTTFRHEAELYDPLRQNPGALPAGAGQSAGAGGSGVPGTPGLSGPAWMPLLTLRGLADLVEIDMLANPSGGWRHITHAMRTWRIQLWLDLGNPPRWVLPIRPLPISIRHGSHADAEDDF